MSCVDACVCVDGCIIIYLKSRRERESLAGSIGAKKHDV
jgi:hypothetical protein